MKKDSWLYSDSFLKRAMAIYGYNLVAGFILIIPVMIVIALVMLVFSAIVGSSVEMTS